MDIFNVPANPVIGVAWGAMATHDFMIGPRYRTLHYEFIATAAAGKTITLADVGGLINLKINGKVQRAHLATELDAIQTSYGVDFQANIYNYDGGAFTWVGGVRQGAQAAKQTMVQLTIYLEEPWRKSYAAQDSMAWFTSWADGSVLKSLQAELFIPAKSANVDAGSAIVVNSFVRYDEAIGPLDSNKKPIALVNKWERTQWPYGGIGDLYIVNLNKRQLCEQISIFSPNAAGVYDAVSNVKVVRDGKTIRDVTRVRNDQGLLDHGFNEAGLTEDRFDVVFDESDLPSDGLVLEGARDFKIIPTVAVAGAAAKILTLISQTYGGID